jgi:parvulin-like peptidyl-prolyl isomerase
MFQEDRQIGRHLIVNRFGKVAVAIFLVSMLLTGIFAADYFGSQKAAAIYRTDELQKDLFGGLSKEEIELLLEDVNPLMLKRLKEDPEMRKQQIKSIRQLLAIANQAIKDGLVGDENTSKALEYIDATIWARTYNQEINKNKSETTATDAQVNAFFGEGGNPAAEQLQHSKEFEEFLTVNTNLRHKDKTLPKDESLSDDEKTLLRREYAGIKILEAEARAQVNAGKLPENFVKKVRLQSKLQLAQFLASTYSNDVLAKKTQATDDEIKQYIAEHAELNLAEKKKAEANKILRRAKNGEDFAALARKFSEDPGSKDKGGLYLNLSEGSLDKDFEKAALALQPGQIAPGIVETPYGYHIIKLVKKGRSRDSNGKLKQSYDVRHIFFSTTVKDPDNPTARGLPVKEYAKSKIEAEKEKKALEKIVADNPVSIAEDFQVQDVSDEEIRKIVQSSNVNVTINANRGNYNK